MKEKINRYRVVCNGRKYRVQKKGLFFWKLYLYGFNEGGGQCYIEGDSRGDCWHQLIQTLCRQDSANAWVADDVVKTEKELLSNSNKELYKL